MKADDQKAIEKAIIVKVQPLYKIPKILPVVFAIVCITGCPRPDGMGIIVENEEQGHFYLKNSRCRVTVDDAIPLMSNEQKGIFLDVGVYNTSYDTLTLIASKSVIISKTDTFTWRNINEYHEGISSYKETKDTVILAPRALEDFHMLFVGKKNYSRKLYRKSNKEDTLYFKLNLFDKDTVEIRMRNHHNGPIWNRY